MRPTILSQKPPTSPAKSSERSRPTSKSPKRGSSPSKSSINRSPSPLKSSLKRSNSVRCMVATWRDKINASSRDGNIKNTKIRSKSTGNLNDISANAEMAKPSTSKASTSKTSVIPTPLDRRDFILSGPVWQENIVLRMQLGKMDRDYQRLLGGVNDADIECLEQKKIIADLYAGLAQEEELQTESKEAKDEKEENTAAQNDSFETAAETKDEVKMAARENSARESTPVLDKWLMRCSRFEGHIEARTRRVSEIASKLEYDRFSSAVISDFRDPLFCCRWNAWKDMAKMQAHLASVQQVIQKDVEELKSRVQRVETGLERVTSEVLPDQSESLKQLEGDQCIVIANVEEMKNGLEELKKRMLKAWGEDEVSKCVECEENTTLSE